MLKKMMAMVASKVMAIKDRMRAIETQLMIQSLLLRDKRMVRHLFRRRNHVKQLDIVQEDDDNSEFVVNSSSVATSPASVVQVAEEIEDTMTMDMEDDDDMYSDPEHYSPLPEEEEEEEGEVSSELKLEDDIDKVADLFIQRFHHQIWLQKQHSDEGIHA
ncbi:uncharacterized protein LOC131016019 [Salvia miltiorrhiza]|uniref:uncharacterized protein LOC131016019 n=1 Tax=Salvia miltiorrhiza TaxID=226208 RepID=UPI0025ABEF5E|nr:uncharacterized protein LOC131016019 [Salvia miltiorrhiza]